jgi:hypothetical protein
MAEWIDRQSVANDHGIYRPEGGDAFRIFTDLIQYWGDGAA